MPKFISSDDLKPEDKQKPVEAQIVPAPDGVETVAEENSPDHIYVGEWYRLKRDEEDDDTNDEAEELLYCVVKVGSNMVELRRPSESGRGECTLRIHLDEWEDRTRREYNPQAHIKDKVEFYQSRVNETLRKIKGLMSRLGVTNHPLLEHHEQVESTSRELATCSGVDNMQDYKKDLIKAKEADLPELFAQVKRHSEVMTGWMQAQMLPLEGKIGSMRETVKAVEGRIFNVELYAGLTEEIEQITDGQPAAMSEKVHLMQRRLYMDEECLLNYRHGGMSFVNLQEFDQWVAEPENLNRILPYQRCVVAMRVRRHKKRREGDGSFRSIFINISYEITDEFTYMYIRNGEKLYRMNCDLDFGEMMFPDKSMLNLSEPMMVKMFANSIDKIIPVREWEDMKARQIKKAEEFKEKMKPYREWEKANPDSDEQNPHKWYGHGWSIENWDRWKPFDEKHLYFDEINQEIADEVEKYNRIVLIIQGLLDRSEAFHPHPPVQLWTPDGFSRIIELVYDSSNVLYENAEPPSFEEYRERCNDQLKVGDVVIGQEDYWKRQEAIKEGRRRDHDWRYTRSYRQKHYSPEGNPGPGYITKVEKIIGGKNPRVKFTWLRHRRMGYDWSDFPEIKTTLSVPIGELFNISAYKLGDFKQFFQDPRTREDYLKWAPILIAAEEYHAGNVKLGVRFDDDEEEWEDDTVEDE